MSYSRMGRPHTTIGAEQFHFRVRDGIGWVTFAIFAKQTGMRSSYFNWQPLPPGIEEVLEIVYNNFSANSGNAFIQVYVV